MSTTTTSEALTAFLKSLNINFAKDLTSRYTVEMECQINVDPSHPKAEPVYDGNIPKRNTWEITDSPYGPYQFHHVRIPRNSMSKPYWDDHPLKFPLAEHIECCGMTGWNWAREQSMWVGFDIDSITGHAKGVGIKDEDMAKVIDAACQIPWVQVRKSTGGGGLHLYVYFDPDNLPSTENHTVHAAVARCVLGLMEREAGFDFRGNMDVLGGNMWFWHRKINEHNRGLEIIKDFTDFCPDLPGNWRDNLDVIKGKHSKVRVKGVNDSDYESFESQSSARAKVIIDDIHQKIEERIEKLGYSIIWVPDHHCWQTHTKAFEELMEEYPEDYVGVFKTLSDGTDKAKPNCYAFPLPNGGLRVNRFGRGAKEHDTWTQDGSDWTWTYFNKPPSLREASAIFGGAEDPDGKGWVFKDVTDVASVVRSLGETLPLTDSWLEIFGGDDSRRFLLRPNKNNQLVIEMDRLKDDKLPEGWIEKGKSKFIKLIRAKTESARDEEDLSYDDRVRALVDVNHEFAQWVILNDDGDWVGQPKDNVRSALRIWDKENAEEILGRLIIKNWKVVSVPFQPEYLGQRRWNRKAPQYAVQPAESGTPHPHWDIILNHSGQDLNDVVKENKWCREAGINNGADYLTYWFAFMFREPYCKLPYLFFYGPQNSGKSILHEGIAMLMKGGIQFAKEALENQGNFNGELTGSVLCVVEEVDLSKQRTQAYNRMKEWTMGEDMLIHPKGKTPYLIKNTTHWMHMANDKSYVPIFPGDTRVVMLYVPMPDGIEIPRDVLHAKLKEEAPAYLRTLLDLKLPPPIERTRLPILSTESKREAEKDTETLVDKFIEEQCHAIPGAITKYTDFYNKMKQWMAPEQAYIWSSHKVLNEFRTRSFAPIVFGRSMNNVACLGNLSLYPRKPDKDYGEPFERFQQKIDRASKIEELRKEKLNYDASNMEQRD